MIFTSIGMTCLKQKMLEANPMEPVLSKITDTLAAGHNVWVVGMLPKIPPGAQLSPIPLPPHPVTGWFCSTYFKHWGFQIALTLASKAQERLLMGIPLAQAVNPFENVMIDFPVV